MHRYTKVVAAVVLAAMCVPLAPAIARAGQTADVAVLLSEARRYFEALDYEHSVIALDQAVAIMEAKPPGDAARKQLAGAYEMRARSRFGLGDEPGARSDFVALLKADPAYGLTGQVSPRVVALFDDAAKATVTTLKLSVTPSTAEVRLDGGLVPSSTTMPVAVGEHTVSAKQLGFRPVTQPVSFVAGEPSEVNIPLERVSSVLAIITVPPAVEIIIDGVSHGKTEPGPPPAQYAEKAAKAGVPASELSQVMLVAEVPPGAHVVDFKRDCYVTTQRRVNVDKPDDYSLDPVKVEHAVAMLNAQTNQPGAVLFIDGQQRGIAPITIDDLCEGDHLVELRSASGRFFKRLSTRTGDKIDLKGALKPAFALVSTSGQAAGLNVDVRTTIERAFEASQSVTIFAPPADVLEKTLGSQQLTQAWLAFDGSKRPIGQSADLGAPTRRDMTAKVARAFDAQGVASVTVPSPLDRNRVVVSLLSAGSGEPDVLEVSLDRPDTVGAAMEKLDRTTSLFRPSIGVTAIDVAGLAGAVVIGVDANGPAAKADIKPGEVITSVNTQPIADAIALNALLASRKVDETLTLELKDRAGAAKRTDVKVFMAPRVIGVADQTVLVNHAVLELRARLQTPGDPLEESVTRLNLAAALARLENWSEARTELQRVKLPDGPGVANGTVQYLLGVCADKLGNRAEAETAWRAAAGSDSLLTEDGPAVKELASARLADPQRPSR